MITEICMKNVASFKQATLNTDKRINLIYGLNGVGKSTISNYFYDVNQPCFSNCSHSSTSQDPILVYNQKFIHDNFFVQDSIKGIFSLSKKNKEAESKIIQASNNKKQLQQALDEKVNEQKLLQKSFQDQKTQAIDTVWQIKTQYSGGDRVFEYCLEGMMSKKEKLFEHILKVNKPQNEPQRNLEEIKKEVESFKDNTSVEIPNIPLLQFDKKNIESDIIFNTAIMGNSDSEVAGLIERLGNADWIKQGLNYLDDTHASSEVKECPFCQAKTITSNFIKSIHDYFDQTYQNNMNKLEQHRDEYNFALNQIPKLDVFIENDFVQNYVHEITKSYNDLFNILQENLNKIKEKIKNPKVPKLLESSSDTLQLINQIIVKINQDINLYNQKLRNRRETLLSLKSEFWSIMRWQYAQTLSRFEQDKKEYEQKNDYLQKEINNINRNIATENQQIIDAQRETVNIDEAITAINNGLQEIGLDSFKISKHSNNLYRIVRDNDSSKETFHSLSEGEKMMISFLYFCELCKGKTDTQDSNTTKIIVIDDPISSLSHIFVFNIGRLIKNIFFKDERKFSQIFVLTHSLYFFYELTDTNHNDRKNTQNLFRISKSSNGSFIQTMKYEEIQNDYQAYWSVINDREQPPALIANCMRNIIEYFFNFVNKQALSNVFQMQELQEIRLQAFYRYINRESHSVGQNIIDMKEFDYDAFRDGLKLVFEKAGYLSHFKKMAKM